MLFQKESTKTKIKNWFVEHKKKTTINLGLTQVINFQQSKFFLGFKNDKDDSANDSGDTANDSDDTEKYCFYQQYVK